MKHSVLLLIITSTIPLHCAQLDKTSKAAEKTIDRKDFFTNSLSVDETYTSFFEFNKTHRNAIIRLLNCKKNYDFRELEVLLCQAARKTLPFYKRYRGSLAFTSGVVLTSILSALPPTHNKAKEFKTIFMQWLDTTIKK